MLAVLTTMDRPQHREATLAQIEAQRPRSALHLFFDGSSGVYERTGWAVHELPKIAHGNAAAFWFVLRAAAAAGDGLVFFEDDIELCGGAVDRMETFPVPADVGAVSFVSAWTSAVCPWGLHRSHGTALMMAQALKLTATGLDAILAARPRPKGVHSDTNLGAAIAAAGLFWGAYVPDLVRHVGVESVANPGSPLELTRVGRTYQGRDFDAVWQLQSATEMGLYR